MACPPNHGPLPLGPQTQELAPWATQEMLDTVQAYFALVPQARMEPCPEHSWALMHAWQARGHASDAYSPTDGFDVAM